MNAPPNREVSLFSAALELPGNQRAAYLSEACADDPALRQRLEELLRVHQDAITFLENKMPGAQPLPTGAEIPDATVRVSSSPAEQTGDRIGRYKLLQQLGEGGCGVVYMAEQEEPVRRRVALKVIKLGMDTKQVVARFEAESQALALMDHPNIAKVLDAGATDTGRPYFVMELVRGIKITEYCDENNLSTEERLDLFIQVCHAVQHAHQKGIIHRDIKPSNILVTVSEPGAPGCPKIIDFGIAKATTGQLLTDKTIFTAFEQFIGTPAYMSPEQAMMTALDIDTRTDIYSLGVLLYELLTGGTPLDQEELLAAGLEEMRRTIREKEPVRPSTRLSTMLEGELTTTAEHRHVDAPKLVRLVRGDLDWIVMKCLEKERQRRYETANGLARDIQRHLNNEPVVARPPSRVYEFQKTVRRHKLGFAAAAAVVMVLAAGVLVSTWQAVRAKAGWTQAKANAAAAASEASKSRQVAQFLGDMLQMVGPSVALGEDTKLLRRVLDQTAERLDTDLAGQPELEAELRITIGRVYFDLGSYKEAEAMFRGALRASGGAGKDHVLSAKALSELGRVLWHEGRLADAATAQQAALAMWRRLLPGDSAEAAFSLHDLGCILQFGNQLGDAEAYYRDGLNMRRRMFGQNHPAVAESLNGMAGLLNAQGRWAEAEKYYRDSLVTYRNLPGDQRLKRAFTLSSMAELLMAEGKVADAEPAAREALEIRKKILGPEHPLVADSLVLMAGVFSDQDKLEEAEAYGREALSIYEKKGNQINSAATCLKLLVDILLTKHEYGEAEELFKHFPISAAGGRPTTVGILQARGNLRARLGRWKDAAADFRAAITLEPANHENYYALAPLLLQSADFDGYRSLCDKIRTRFAGCTNDPDIAERMAQDCLLLPSPDADLTIETTWADLAVKLGQNEGGIPWCYFCKGFAEYRQRRFGNAVDWTDKSLAREGKRPPRDVQACMVLAMAKYQLNQLYEARAVFARGVQIADHNLPKLKDGALDHRWINWLIAEALIREARALIEDEAGGE